MTSEHVQKRWEVGGGGGEKLQTTTTKSNQEEEPKPNIIKRNFKIYDFLYDCKSSY